MRQAEKLTDRRRGEPHWPWVFNFDAAKMARYQASALTRLGDLKPAHAAFDAAMPALTAPKPQAMAQIERAHAFAGMGNVGAGCLLATQALSVGHTYGSERITTRVRDFRASLPTRTREARDLDDALAALLRAGDLVTKLAISGHRELPAQTTELVAAGLRAEVAKHAGKDLVGLSCLADGADSLFAQAILEAGGSLVAVVPARKYRDGFPESHHATYDALLFKAARVIELDHIESNSEAHMNASLRMLDEADELVAVWDGQPARGYGGTADVVSAAEKRGLLVVVVWPDGAVRD